MKKLILTFILGIFLLNSMFALDSLGVGKQNQNFTFCQTCSDATYITLSTLQYPDKTVIPINDNMTASGSSFCYNITTTSQLGRYDVTGISDGCEKTFAAYFEISPSGFVGTLGFYIILLVLSLGIIILGYSVQDAWVVILGAFGFILFGLFILIYGIDGIKDTYYTYGVGIITIMLGAYFAVRGALEKMNDGLDL